MEGEVFVITIVAIACTSGLIRSWINRHKNNNSVDEESFDRLARAFMQHKKEMQERVEHLEAIITDQDEEHTYTEIEASEDKGTLTNDLQKNNRVRS